MPLRVQRGFLGASYEASEFCRQFAPKFLQHIWDSVINKNRKKLEMIQIFREDLSVPGQVAQRALVLRNVGDSCEAKVLSWGGWEVLSRWVVSLLSNMSKEERVGVNSISYIAWIKCWLSSSSMPSGMWTWLCCSEGSRYNLRQRGIWKRVSLSPTAFKPFASSNVFFLAPAFESLLFV